MFGGPGAQGVGGPDAGFASQWQGGGPRSKLLGQTPPPGQQPASPAPVSSDQIATVSQKLAATEDDRKLLAARMQQMEIQLQEKDKMLILSNYEVQEAAKQVSQTREELRRWKQEMETLRGQLHNAEKENKGTLDTMIRTLEQFMEREKKETGKVSN